MGRGRGSQIEPPVRLLTLIRQSYLNYGCNHSTAPEAVPPAPGRQERLIRRWTEKRWISEQIVLERYFCRCAWIWSISGSDVIFDAFCGLLNGAATVKERWLLLILLEEARRVSISTAP